MAELQNSPQNQTQQKTPTKLISECFIKPKQHVESAKKPYHLTRLEIGGLNIDPIQKGLLFSLQNTTQTISHLLHKLKYSLAITLVHFYPLAGRFTILKYPENNSSSIFLDCTKGAGTRFIHASTLDFSIYDIISSKDVPKIVNCFFELGEKSVNFDGHTRTLLTVQVTELRDGVFIGFTLNHCVGDGTSFLHFVNMLSEIFNTFNDYDSNNNNDIPNISRMPIFNYYKVWYDNLCENEDFEVVKLPNVETERLIEHDYDPGPLRERIFNFSTTCLATLKAKANQECGTHNSISSFQSLIALVWRSITRARNLSSEELTSCSMLVNARSRFDPPINDDYFGNYISQAKGICNVGELLGHNLGWAAMILNEAIKAQNVKAIRGFYKEIGKGPLIISRDMVSEIHGPNNLTVGGSARFDMYGPEFGLGRALGVWTGYANKSDGKVTLAQGREGVGSVDLEICLRPCIMDALEIDEEFTNFMSLE